MLNLIGTIEGPATMLEKLDPVVDWQEGGRSDGSLSLVESSFGRVGLGLLRSVEEPGPKGFGDMLERFSGGNLSEGASCFS